MDALVTQRVDVAEIIRSYDDWIVRAYCWGRFKVLRRHFLDEISQYLPSFGRVLDIGCGFGLFSLYFARKFPNLEICGIDVNPKRIDIATRTAAKLSLSNVTYEVADARTANLEYGFDCCYMLDIVHHIPRDAALPLFVQIYEHLRVDSRLIVKDVDTKPAYKRWFTYIMDKMMDINADVNYWKVEDLRHLLKSVGFEVFFHSMSDILPYPHVLYVARKVPSPVEYQDSRSRPNSSPVPHHLHGDERV